MFQNLVVPLMCAVLFSCSPGLRAIDPPPSLREWPPSFFHAKRVPPQRHQAAIKPMAMEMPEGPTAPPPAPLVKVPVGDLLGRDREAALKALGPATVIHQLNDESQLTYIGPDCQVTLHYWMSNRDWRWHLLRVDGADACRVQKSE